MKEVSKNRINHILYRENSTIERFYALDGIRFISFIMILLVHSFFCMRAFFADTSSYVAYLQTLPSLISGFVSKGDLAIEMFFVFSAYLLACQLFEQLEKKRTLNFRWYYMKRVLRIYPIYVFALCLFAIPSVLAGAENHKYIWANLLGVNNLLGLENIFLVWTWSISAEIQFYLLCPLLVLFAYKMPRRFFIIMLVLIAVSLCWRYWHLRSPVFVNKGIAFLDILLQDDKQAANYFFDNIYMHPVARYTPFLIGLMAAYVNVMLRDQVVRILSDMKWAVSLTCLSVFLMVFVFYGMQTRLMPADMLTAQNLWWLYYFEMVTKRFIFSVGLAIFIVLLASQLGLVRWANKFLSMKVFFPLSQLTYSMYLFHPLVLWPPYFVCKHFNLFSAPYTWVEPTMVTLLVLLLSFALGLLVYKYVEYPFLKGRIFSRAKVTYG